MLQLTHCRAALFLLFMLTWPVQGLTAVPLRLSTAPSIVEKSPAYVYEVVSAATSEHQAGLGDDVLIRVANLDEYLIQVHAADASRSWSASDLVPVIDGILLPETFPTSIQSEPAGPDDLKNGVTKLTTLQFHLANEGGAAKAAWTRLLSHPQFSKVVPVTVGVNGKGIEPVTSYVTKDANIAFGYIPFKLIVIRTGVWLFSGITIILISLLLFFWLANRTTLLRDTSASRRPDGEWPLSLARTQMAFWFFLTIVSFILLWLITGAQDTLSSSVLILIGISAGTALGAAVVDSGKQSGDPGYHPVISDGPRKTTVTQLKIELDARKTALQERQKALNDLIDANAPVVDAENARQKIIIARDAVETTRSAFEFFQRSPWKRVVFDLLGDSGSIGFHRFQMAVWTLVLGTLFISQVYSQLSMPDFSNTLLGLVGISAGTYIGFKIPEGAR